MLYITAFNIATLLIVIPLIFLSRATYMFVSIGTLSSIRITDVIGSGHIVVAGRGAVTAISAGKTSCSGLLDNYQTPTKSSSEADGPRPAKAEAVV